MKKIFNLKCFIINFSLAILVSCGSNKNITSNWQERPLEATGVEKDWGEALMFDAKSKFWYKVSNDGSNLYIMLKMDDEALKRKVLMNGLKVFVDTTNHKKEKFGVHFPVKRNFNPEARDGLREQRANQGARNPDRMKDRLLEELQEIELIGFNNRESDMLMIGESKIRPVVMFDQYNAIIYQLVLPLGYACKSLAPKKIVSIGFVIGSASRPNMGEPNENREGRRGGGGGMRGGGFGGREGGMGHGRPEGGGRGVGEMSQATAFWVKDYCLTCKNN